MKAKTRRSSRPKAAARAAEKRAAPPTPTAKPPDTLPATLPDTSPDDYGFLTSREVLAILRISPATLLKLEQTHALPYLRIGRKALFKKADLDAFIAAKTIK